MTSTSPTPVAIIGSGNIGTDLMFKLLRVADELHVAAMVGIDPRSDGLARARGCGIPTTADGVAGLLAMPGFDDIRVVFDATSAEAHVANAARLSGHGKQLVDLTPAAIGPYVVPVVNLDGHLDAPNINMVTCGGQATVPIVAAVSGVAPVHYAEIVASIASRSAGPGTRANIDEFTETTARALEVVGGATRGKAIIILNPADPPMIMRDTVLCITDAAADEGAIATSIESMVDRVAAYVPGYRLKQDVQFSRLPARAGRVIGVPDGPDLLKVSVFLEVTGAAHYLPAYAGNLDIMTSAAVEVARSLAMRSSGTVVR